MIMNTEKMNTNHFYYIFNSFDIKVNGYKGFAPRRKWVGERLCQSEKNFMRALE